MPYGENVVTDGTSQKLPEYANPPISEVACGVLFEPIAGLLNAYLGLLWEKYRAQYPICQEAPPLMPTIEKFDGEEPNPQAVFDGTALLPRTWFVEAKQTGLVQIQRDRFLVNWRKMAQSDSYPRYHTVIQNFRDGFTTFAEFIAEHQLGEIRPLQFELTYVNHIPQGEGWNSMADIGKLFPDFSWRDISSRHLPPLENIDWNSSFVLPEKQGRLHARIQSAKRIEDDHKLIVLHLTARGIGNNPINEGMFQWFELARNWIVRGFADLTGEEVQKTVWRRTQ